MRPNDENQRFLVRTTTDNTNFISKQSICIKKGHPGGCVVTRASTHLRGSSLLGPTPTERIETRHVPIDCCFEEPRENFPFREVKKRRNGFLDVCVRALIEEDQRTSRVFCNAAENTLEKPLVSTKLGFHFRFKTVSSRVAVIAIRVV